MNLINGNEVAQIIRLQIKEEVSKIKSEGRKVPHLTAILVGEDGASKTYVAAKEKDCQEVGFESTVLRFDVSITEIELLF